MDLDINTKHLSIFYEVLDKFYPEWEKRDDHFYLTELSFLIREVFKSPYTDETLINNLRQSEVRKYQAELKAILNTPKEALEWILKHRMSEDRRKMCETKYLKKGKRWQK